METRRDKALLRIAQYRGELGAGVLRKASNQLIESKVVELPRAASKKRTAATRTGQWQAAEPLFVMAAPG